MLFCNIWKTLLNCQSVVEEPMMPLGKTSSKCWHTMWCRGVEVRGGGGSATEGCGGGLRRPPNGGMRGRRRPGPPAADSGRPHSTRSPSPWSPGPPCPAQEGVDRRAVSNRTLGHDGTNMLGSLKERPRKTLDGFSRMEIFGNLCDEIRKLFLLN